MSIQDAGVMISCSITVGALTFNFVKNRIKQKKCNEKRLEHLESESKRLNNRCEHNEQIDVLLLKATFAMVDVFHKQGHNGPVTKAHEALQAYIIENRIE